MPFDVNQFVFEPASGTCVLLPHVDNSKVVSSHNAYTIAGSLQITIVKQQTEVHGQCDFATSSVSAPHAQQLRRLVM
jgi:hypothetical protein